ncbi:MAG: phosphoribosylglycinamide formyltransferase [Methanobacteriota archaeon]
MTRVGVLASGRGSNLQAILDAEMAGRLGKAHVVVVASDKPEAEALARAKARDVAAVSVPSTGKDRAAHDAEMVKVLRDHRVDLVCLAGYMRILSSSFIQAFPGRIMNVHPALLPAFPGLHAQEQAFRHGAKIAGCTTHFVDDSLDGGPIILQAAVPVLEDDTAQTLADRILLVEHRLYPATVRLFADGRLKVEGRRVRILPGPEKVDAWMFSNLPL